MRATASSPRRSSASIHADSACTMGDSGSSSRARVISRSDSSSRPRPARKSAYQWCAVRVRRVELDRPPEARFGRCPVPLVQHRAVRERRVRLGERGIDRERAVDRVARAGPRFARRRAGVERRGQVRVGEPRPRAREAGIAPHGILEEPHRVEAPRRRPLGERVPAPQILLVRLGVRRRRRRDALLRPAAEPHAQLRRDRARDLLLDGEHVGELAVVALAPELEAVRRAHELTPARARGCPRAGRCRRRRTSRRAGARRSRDRASAP